MTDTAETHKFASGQFLNQFGVKKPKRHKKEYYIDKELLGYIGVEPDSSDGKWVEQTEIINSLGVTRGKFFSTLKFYGGDIGTLIKQLK